MKLKNSFHFDEGPNSCFLGEEVKFKLFASVLWEA
jgi:hypothetical protein